MEFAPQNSVAAFLLSYVSAAPAHGDPSGRSARIQDERFARTMQLLMHQRLLAGSDRPQRS